VDHLFTLSLTYDELTLQKAKPPIRSLSLEVLKGTADVDNPSELRRQGARR